MVGAQRERGRNALQNKERMEEGRSECRNKRKRERKTGREKH